MKLLLFISFLLFADFSRALEIPKDFEASSITGENTKLWIQPKTFETINTSNDKLSEFEVSPSKDAFAEIKETIEAKANTLSWILNIKNWKILDSTSVTKEGSQLIIFFGSYFDSSNELTMFAEVYWFPKKGEPESYLFTRAKQPYSSDELAKRFKVEIP